MEEILLAAALFSLLLLKGGPCVRVRRHWGEVGTLQNEDWANFDYYLGMVPRKTWAHAP